MLFFNQEELKLLFLEGKKFYTEITDFTKLNKKQKKLGVTRPLFNFNVKYFLYDKT